MNSIHDKKPIRGLMAAAFTPFHEDGTLDLHQIPAIVDHLEQTGIAGIYALGTTGEGISLASDERMQVAEAYLEAARERMPVVINVGHDCLTESCRLAAHAQQSGAFAISAACPAYFPVRSLSVLVDIVAQVAAAAPSLPFYYYHIPELTAASFNMVDFLRLAGQRVPSLRGIKFTATNIHEYQTCLELDDGRFDILFGRDEMLLSALAAGGRGAVGSTCNFLAPLYHGVIQAVARGDWQEARQLQARAISVIQVLMRFDLRPALKAMMKLIGVDCGPCRLPLATFTENDYRQLAVELEATRIFSPLLSKSRKAPDDAKSICSLLRGPHVGISKSNGSPARSAT